MKIISFINQKGGTGKTTTALNVGACLAREGYSVLLIDVDPQGSLTNSVGIELEDTDPTLYEVLQGEADVNSVIQVHNNYSVIPTDIRQGSAELILSKEIGAEQLIKIKIIDKLQTAYDYILIDCAPNLSLITVMCLAASTHVIVPIQAQYLPLKGMTQLLDTVELVKERINPALEVMGFLLTMYDNRKTLDREIKQSIYNAYPEKLFKTTISSNVALAEAPAYKMDIYEYNPSCKGAMQYEALTDEIIERG